MSRVDDELAKAVAESEATAPKDEAAPVTRAAPLEPGNPKRNLGLLAALLVMGGGILTLVMTSFDNAAVYSRGVDALVKEKDKLVGRNVRVEGALVKGSLKRRDQPCEYRFSLAKGGVSVPVRYAQCIVPDTFRDMPGMDVSVTAEGTLAQSGDFEATHIMAKCPSKYEMRDRAGRGEQAPHNGMAASYNN
ncbi:MAG: cytochrome c maturation protein CcmE [Polyangiaceae bacterium]